jgi:hypothetical protein
LRRAYIKCYFELVKTAAEMLEYFNTAYGFRALKKQPFMIDLSVSKMFMSRLNKNSRVADSRFQKMEKLLKKFGILINEIVVYSF